MIIHHKPKKHQNLSWQLGGENLERVKTYKYLGVDLCQCVGLGSNALPFKSHHERIISKAEVRLNMVKFLGLSKDGLRLPTAIRLYKLLIRPIMEYAAPILSYSKSQLLKYERFQLKCLKTLIGLQHFGTLSAGVRLLAGVEPMKSRFDFLKIKYFHKLRMMGHDRIVYKVFRHRFDDPKLGCLADVKEALVDNGIEHEYRFKSTQDLLHFSKFIKLKILTNSYKRDAEELSKSSSARIFNQLLFPAGSYLKAKPQSFCVGKHIPYPDDWEKAFEERKSRTGFLQALLGKHPIHFMQHENSADNGQNSVDILERILFDSKKWESERKQWIEHLENDFSELSDNKMNATLLKILKESTKPVNERNCETKTITMIAFGGHTALKNNGNFVVTRKKIKRLGVSAILARRTADFLQEVYTKLQTQ